VIWKLNKIQYPVYNLGPGKRLGIWVQGCSIGCSGCINKSTWKTDGGKNISVIDLFNFIDLICKDYDGITISGGEPFDQYSQLMAFSYFVKRKTSLNIFCYTGYYLEELDQKFPDKAFYSCIDFLVDGRFEKETISDNPLKGSGNQNMYSFENNLPVRTYIKNDKKKWSLKCENNTVYMAGIPLENEMDSITAGLFAAGIRSELV
jgi:anaerobic ribonucleoside-triphosphate reductase activating protein